MNNDILNINNFVKTYNDQKYESGPVAFTDYVNDKLNIVHSKLYNNALVKFLKEKWTEQESEEPFITWKKNFMNTHKIAEIKGNEYFVPSSIIVYELFYPYNKTKYDLTKYWDNKYTTINKGDVSDIMIDEDTLKYAEIIYVDYVNGRCKMKSKLTQNEFWAPFKYINNNTKFSNEFVLDTTFTELLKNI